METDSVKKTSWKKEVFYNIFYIFLIIIFEFFLFQPFRVPSGSMIPNFSLGDEILVTKYSYGYSSASWPVPYTNINFISGRYKISSPKRGDIVVFKNPKNISENYVKRLIGLPGDVIQIKDSVLYLNHKPVEEMEIKGEQYNKLKSYNYGEKMEGKWRFYQETIPTGASNESISFNILKLADNQNNVNPVYNIDPNNTEEYIVPAKHYFVMGDDRDNSLDSRFLEKGVGYLPESNLVGKTSTVLFSIKPTDVPFPFSLVTIPFRFRWDKFLNHIN